jgi:hypothetical protein
MRPSELVSARLLYDSPRRQSGAPEVARVFAVALRIRKYGVGRMWPMVYAPGSWVYVTVPRLGLAAHPFSVWSVSPRCVYSLSMMRRC